MIRASQMGLMVGLTLGIVAVFGSFASMLVVALAGLVGWVVGRVLQGELDLSEYVTGSRFRRSR